MPRDVDTKTMSTVAVRSLLQAADALGLDATTVLGEVGLDEHVLGDGEARVSEETGGRLWDRLERLSGDATFGLRVAEAIDPAEFGLLGYVCRSAGTLGEALALFAEHVRFLSDSSQITIHAERDRVRVRLELGTWPNASGREAVLALLVLRARRVTGRPLVPREVRFRHERPADPSAYRRLFGAPVTFLQRHDEIVIDRSVLDVALPTADATLRDLLLGQSRALHKPRQALDGLLERLRRTVEEGLRTHDVGLSTLAARLHLSPRTLQRRLSDEGTSLQALVDETRRNLALRLLESEVPIAEATYLLGFSEPSAFHRAFKRWTGQTPAQLRGRRRS